MQTIDDIVSTGYSNLEAEQGSSEPKADDKDTQETPAPADKEHGETPKESGTLENTETDPEGDIESEDDDLDPEDQGQENKGKRSKGIEKRIKKLTRAQAELRKEADYWREQAMRQTSQQPQGEDPARAEQSRGSSNGKPNPNDFETSHEYLEALFDWQSGERQKAELQKSQINHFQQKVQKHDGRVKEFKAQAPDYDLTVQEFRADHPHFDPNQELVEMIVESELSAPLSYELFKNPDLLVRINSLPPAQAARELGRLESQIERTIEEKKRITQTKKTTSAPPPFDPLTKSSAQAGTQKSINEMTPDEYIEYRRQQRK